MGMRLMNTPDFGLEVLVVGGLRTNCYILWRKGSGTAVVIDPGGSVDKILEFISVENLNVKFIINTHGHDDHIGGNRDLRKTTGAKVLVGAKDAYKLLDSKDTFKLLKKMGGTQDLQADDLLKEGDTVAVDGIELEVIETPGHSIGGISLIWRSVKTVFTGDTLFKCGIGRYDFEDGDEKVLWNSIFDKLFVLDDDFIVCPGHGDATTIGTEKARYANRSVK